MLKDYENVRKDRRVKNIATHAYDNISATIMFLKRCVRDFHNGYCLFTDVNHITGIVTVYFVNK